MNLFDLVEPFFSGVSKRLTLIYNLFKGLLPEWKCHCIPRAVSRSLKSVFSGVDSGGGALPFTKMYSRANPKHDASCELGPKMSQNLVREHAFFVSAATLLVATIPSWTAREPVGTWQAPAGEA